MAAVVQEPERKAGTGGGGARTRGDAAAGYSLDDEVEAEEEAAVMAYVYVDKRHELYGDWDYGEFRDQHLEEYRVMCEEFRRDVQDNELPPEGDGDVDDERQR